MHNFALVCNHKWFSLLVKISFFFKIILVNVKRVVFLYCIVTVCFYYFQLFSGVGRQNGARGESPLPRNLTIFDPSTFFLFLVISHFFLVLTPLKKAILAPPPSPGRPPPPSLRYCNCLHLIEHRWCNCIVI